MNPQDLSPQLAQAMRERDYARLREIVGQCPLNAMTEEVLGFPLAPDKDHPFMATSALLQLALGYVTEGAYALAEAFATVGMHEALTLYAIREENDPINFEFLAAHSLDLMMQILNSTGRPREAYTLYDETSTRYPTLAATPDFLPATLEAAETLLVLNEAGRAREIFAGIQESALSPAYRPSYDRIRRDLSYQTTSVTTLPEEFAASHAALEAKGIADLIEGWKRVSEKDGLPIEVDFERLMASLASAQNEDERMDLLMEQLAHINSPKMDGWALADPNSLAGFRYRYEALLRQFASDADHSPEPQKLRDSIAEHEALIALADTLFLPDDAEQLLYTLHYAYARLEAWAEAARCLNDLAGRLEAKRSRVQSPDERAGIFQRYPDLFSRLCQMHSNAGNMAGALEAAEATKGRNLADTTQEAPELGALTNALKTPDADVIKATLHTAGCHYLSYLVCGQDIYVAFMSKDGHTLGGFIGGAADALDSWLQKGYADPVRWESPRAGLFGQKKDISRLMTPLLSPLQKAIEAGWVAAGDHIVYSPDGPLYFFPLHYVRLSDDFFLIERHSVSRVHGAGQLVQLLEEPAQRPRTAQSVSTPSANDGPENAAAFGEVERWLAAHLPSETVAPSVEAVLEHLRSDGLVHFATHGTFPKKPFDDPRQNNPFYSSGLLLRDEAGELPQLDPYFQYFSTPHLLNPARLTEAAPDVSGSHFTLQACVSGNARRGAGGDALGLEWALFRCGAASILGANWDVSLAEANTFCARFYDHWLLQGKSRAAAHRSAMCEGLHDVSGAPRPVQLWGGLTLSGDFR